MNFKGGGGGGNWKNKSFWFLIKKMSNFYLNVHKTLLVNTNNQIGGGIQTNFNRLLKLISFYFYLK